MVKEDKQEFWTTKVHGDINDGEYFNGMVDKLNKFMEGRFVIATQVHYDPKRDKWCSIVWYKEKPIKK